MKKYLYSYINDIDNILKNNKKVDYDSLIEKHLIKINFFSHERLIHLIVTLFYSLFDLLFFYYSLTNPLCLIILFIITVILLFYIVHYFRLENGVQYLYKQYDIMVERKESGK